jgi:hypothetical protein
MRFGARRLGALAALLLSGCYTVSYQTRLPGTGFRREEVLSYWLFGIVGHHDIDLAKMCPHGATSWQTRATAGGLLDVITLGIYTPRTLEVECARAP